MAENRRPGFYVAFLLLLLAMLMGSHLWLLNVGLQECDEYSDILRDKLRAAPPDSPLHDKLQKQWQEYLDGGESECAAAEDVFAKTSGEYTKIILALLTGAGVAAGVERGHEMGQRKRDEEPPANN